MLKNNYRYKGITLQPENAKVLIVELCSGMNISTKDIRKKILNHHLKNGGEPPINQKGWLSRSLKHILDKNLGEDLGYGAYRIYENSKNKSINNFENTEQKESNDSTAIINTHQDLIIGYGEQSVYVYYFPTFKKYAESEKERYFKVKIGYTTRDTDTRIGEQYNSTNPEPPEVLLELKTEDSKVLEGIIHDILKERDRWVTEGKGKEWFLSSEVEIREIHNFVMQIDNKTTQNKSPIIFIESKKDFNDRLEKIISNIIRIRGNFIKKISDKEYYKTSLYELFEIQKFVYNKENL